MINFSPSNDKIYNRCIHQIAFCAKCSRAEAELALIRVGQSVALTRSARQSPVAREGRRAQARDGMGAKEAE